MSRQCSTTAPTSGSARRSETPASRMRHSPVGVAAGGGSSRPPPGRPRASPAPPAAPRRARGVVGVHDVEQRAADQVARPRRPSARSSAGRGPGDPQVVVEDDDGVAARLDQRAELGLAAAQAGAEPLLLAGGDPAVQRGERDAAAPVPAIGHRRRAVRRRQARRRRPRHRRRPARACGSSCPSVDVERAACRPRPGRARGRASRSTARASSSRPAATQEAAGGDRHRRPASTAEVISPRPAVEQHGAGQQRATAIVLPARLDGAQQRSAPPPSWRRWPARRRRARSARCRPSVGPAAGRARGRAADHDERRRRGRGPARRRPGAAGAQPVGGRQGQDRRRWRAT